MRTVRKNGWLIEQGPNSALETTPLFRMMFESLGILEERVYANPLAAKRHILRNGTLHALPMSPGAFLKSDLWSLMGKLRLLKEPFVGKGVKEESIAEFVERRLGKEFLDYAINPFVAGVYAGNPEHLSVRAAFPKLYALEDKYGGLIKGMIRGGKERKLRAEQSKDRAKLFSFRMGMEVFPAAIATQLGDSVKTGCEIWDVRCESRNAFAVHYSRGGERMVEHASTVVLSSPAHVVAGMIRGLSPSLSSGLESIYYPPLAEVFLGFRTEQVVRPLDGFGFLVPQKENRKILGTVWSSSLFEGRAPDGHVALTTFVGGARQPELVALEDNDLRAMVLEEIRPLLGITGSPVFASITRWPRAIPQYSLGYLKTLAEIETFEKANPGLFLCSNFRGGIAIGDCITSSERTAFRILEHLGRRQETAPAVATI